jgi:hypothetical protein
MKPVSIVLNVYGGSVQGVFASQPDIEIILVDWDVAGADAEHPDVVTVRDALGRTRHAYVARPTAQPLSELAGSEVEAAIEAAELVSN